MPRTRPSGQSSGAGIARIVAFSIGVRASSTKKASTNKPKKRKQKAEDADPARAPSSRRQKKKKHDDAPDKIFVANKKLDVEQIGRIKETLDKLDPVLPDDVKAVGKEFITATSGFANATTKVRKACFGAAEESCSAHTMDAAMGTGKYVTAQCGRQ